MSSQVSEKVVLSEPLTSMESHGDHRWGRRTWWGRSPRNSSLPWSRSLRRKTKRVPIDPAKDGGFLSGSPKTPWLKDDLGVPPCLETLNSGDINDSPWEEKKNIGKSTSRSVFFWDVSWYIQDILRLAMDYWLAVSFILYSNFLYTIFEMKICQRLIFVWWVETTNHKLIWNIAN